MEDHSFLATSGPVMRVRRGIGDHFGRGPAAPSYLGQKNVIAGCLKAGLQVLPQSVACCDRVSRDYLDLFVSALTWDVRTSKGISEAHVILPLNLKKILHGANLQNSPISPEVQVIR
jgi:hypothetical protein